MCHLKSLLCTALCSSLISIFKTIFDEKICKGKGWALEQNSFWKCFESYGIVHSWKIWFHEIYQFKSGASFHVWQIILIFGCKLMVFLPLPLGKKRHFTNYYGAGQRHLCLLASVLAWHIGPLTQMPEEGKERGWQHSFDAMQDLWKVTQVHVAGVFQTGAQIKLGHWEEFSLRTFLNKIFFKYPCWSIISRADFGSILTVWFFQWSSSAYFF